MHLSTLTRTGWVFLVAMVALTSSASAQSSDDATAIRQAALDYIEGWYTGDVERMERALHPELAKRIVNTNPETGESELGHQGAKQLIKGTKEGYGEQIPESRRRKEVTILDIYENAASVKIVASDWIDYLHLAEWNGEWKIVNVLWELTPEAKQMRQEQAQKSSN